MKIIEINPKIYDLETIYAASYVFLDKAYIQLDGDPKSKIIVTITAKKVEEQDTITQEFQNELINYGDYKNRASQTKQIREMILQRSLFANDPSSIPDDDFEQLLKEIEDENFDNSSDIAVPWEDKYGKDNNK